jgi:DNA-binding transcriptional LysR family regulator
MTVELRHLRCFLAIVDEQNITRAAQNLHISQPALSRTLAQLERIVGVRLVDRSTHHLTLTDAGNRFGVTARDAVRGVDEAVAGMSAVVPPIRLGHNWSSATHAAAIMRSWKSEFPDRKLQLRRSDERIAGLAAGKVDVALVRGPVADRSFRSTSWTTKPDGRRARCSLTGEGTHRLVARSRRRDVDRQFGHRHDDARPVARATAADDRRGHVDRSTTG